MVMGCHVVAEIGTCKDSKCFELLSHISGPCDTFTKLISHLETSLCSSVEPMHQGSVLLYTTKRKVTALGIFLGTHHLQEDCLGAHLPPVVGAMPLLMLKG